MAGKITDYRVSTSGSGSAFAWIVYRKGATKYDDRVVAKGEVRPGERSDAAKAGRAKVREIITND